MLYKKYVFYNHIFFVGEFTKNKKIVKITSLFWLFFYMVFLVFDPLVTEIFASFFLLVKLSKISRLKIVIFFFQAIEVGV